MQQRIKKQDFMNESELDSDQKKRRLNVEVRQMEIDDLATVFHLGEKLFTAQEVPNLYRTWDEYEVISLFQSDAEYCLVAEAEDRIVGFALGTTVTKSRSAWKYGYLIWLGIDPEFHGQGIASKLFHRFRDLMLEDGVRMLLVDTEADNLPALHFFRKMGFGSPQEHIYLALNLDDKLRRLREKRTNGKPSPRFRIQDE
jgi:ribosomal protein S18 acetylase RimI-like enzyme